VSMDSEPEIKVRTREDVLYLLAEAAEIEHNLMCCYLYAAFGLKRSEDGLSADDAALVSRWRSAITGVAIEEMTHLTLVANLTVSLGGRPHFGRPNFPVAPGYHPAGVVVRLAPFNMDTLDHFIFLERPAGSDLADSPAFAPPMNYERVVAKRRVMPSAQDYATVGHLYRGIRSGLDHLAESLGENALFVCGPSHQVGPSVASLPGLCTVEDLASACRAIDTVVDQGEGAGEYRDDSHFARFRQIKREYAARLAADSGFSPSRPIATNPVMRKPMQADDRVYIDAPLSAAVVDLANALYGQMLRFLAQAFGRAQPLDADQSLLIDGAIEMMRCMVPLAEALTALTASPSRPGVNAGMTFAMLRNLAPAIEGSAEWTSLAARVSELADAAADLAPELPVAGSVAERLRALGPLLAARQHATQSTHQAASSREAGPAPAANVAPPSSRVEEGVEIVRGKALTIKFNGKRCIHSRFCVLWQPHVYKANVAGAWIDPDADSVEASVAVAHNCPSGAHSIRAPRRWPGGIRTAGKSDQCARERAACRARANSYQRRSRRNAGHSVSVRCLEEQAVLRRIACGCRLSGEWRAEDDRDAGARSAGRSARHRAAAERTAARARQSRNLLWYRPHRQTQHRRSSLPLRTIAEQAVLRRLACKGRISSRLSSAVPAL
jgi:uncharacterized Fe-S cluster protein YjdI